MRALVLAALVACSSSKPVEPPAVTIPDKPLPIGTIVTRTREMRIDADIERNIRKLEILDADRRMILQARVTYIEGHPSLRGNTYVGVWGPNGLEVTREGTTAGGDDWELRVAGDLADTVGVDDAYLKSFIGVPLVKGKTITLAPVTLEAQMPGAKVTSAEVKLVDVRGDLAVVELVYKGTANGQSFESRETSEWSLTTGRQMKTIGSAGVGERKIEGTSSYEYAEKR